MAPGLGMRLFKREAPEEADVEEGEPEVTTLATHIFGKHLHKVRITTPTTTLETEGNLFLLLEKLQSLLLLHILQKKNRLQNRQSQPSKRFKTSHYKLLIS